ncbi:unnamed protein product [Mytilus coruscus]|uniref:Uncharacterized protein n=1 Tax=Mytilus coruscus TaxID=42192 RepID=A0A6J8EF50_MYTCO|nr:unnamed protein product [Mytilus coruscus]
MGSTGKAETDIQRKKYTIKDISIHNKSKGFIDIFPFKNKVYSTSKFKDAMRSVVKQIYAEKFKDRDHILVFMYNVDVYEEFYDIWKYSPIYLVLFKYENMYLSFSDIKDELPACKIADVIDSGELSKDIVEDSTIILDDLKGDPKITEYKKEYQDSLQRCLDMCKKLTSRAGMFTKSHKPNERVSNPNRQDPNTITFPIPEPIQADLTVLRKWTETWELFDTDLEDSKGLPDFDFTIEGEAAWAVIELDIVKNDKTTEEQERVWRSRENRINLNDPMSSLSRQTETRLEMYFINKYEWHNSKLDPYRGFTTRLQKAWKEFQALVEAD